MRPTEVNGARGRTFVCILVATATAACGVPSAMAAVPGPHAVAAVPATRDSGLAFRPLRHSSDRFSVSDLTRLYERDLSVWTNVDRQPAGDLAWLDRHGSARPVRVAAHSDSSDLDVVEGAEGRDPTAMTRAEKEAAEPPKPPISTAIPSPIAVAGSLVGGLAILVKLIAALAK